MRISETVEELFINIMTKPEYRHRQIYADENYISDANIAILRKFLPKADAIAQKEARIFVEPYITKAINEKGEFVGTFEVKREYKNCYYDSAIGSIIVPVGYDKKWGVDMRWVERITNQFAIEEFKVYPFISFNRKRGCILEAIGWANGEEYTDIEEYVIGYIVSCYMV